MGKLLWNDAIKTIVFSYTAVESVRVYVLYFVAFETFVVVVLKQEFEIVHLSIIRLYTMYCCATSALS